MILHSSLSDKPFVTLLQGVLEAIRISCAGYPTKRTFDEFLDRFGTLAPDVLDGYISQSVITWFHILNPFQEETNTGSLRQGEIYYTLVVAIPYLQQTVFFRLINVIVCT